MKLFKRKKKNVDTCVKSLTDKIIEALNFVPADFVHTDEYRKISVDPVKDAKLRIADMDVDELSKPLDALYAAKINSEKISGRLQYIHHLNAIKQITDTAREQKILAFSLREHLEEDKKRYLEERDNLNKLYRGM